MAGWISLHRASMDHWIYEDSDYWKIWTTMLFKASHKDNKILINGQLVELKRGQFIFGRERFSAETNIPVSKIRRCIKLLKSDQQISQQITRKYSIISITNYDRYQKANQQSDQQTTIKRPSNDHQTTTNNNVNKVNNVNNMDFSSWPEKPSDQVLSDWLAMRKRLKADVSQTVINRLSRELKKAHARGMSVDDCLSECVTRGWRGFKLEWVLPDSDETVTRASL